MYCGGRRCTPWRAYREAGIVAARTCGDGHAALVVLVGNKYRTVIQSVDENADLPVVRTMDRPAYDRLGAAKQAADRRLSDLCGRRRRK